jgi:protein TonB
MDITSNDISLVDDKGRSKRSWAQLFDRHAVSTAVTLSLVVHIGTLGFMVISEHFKSQEPPAKPQVAKVRIFANPNGSKTATATKVVEMAKPKNKPKPNARAITKTTDEKPQEVAEETNSLPQSFGDDPTGGIVGTGVSNTDGSAGENANAEPIERVKPEFPQEAALKGIEGWVLLRFDIREDGGVENISVVDASPRGMFEKKAREAIRKWKYAPRISNGEKVRVVGREVQIDFKLEG